MKNKEEEILQTACITWFDYQYPHLSKLLFAVPNGGSRHKIEAKNLKKQGVRAGVSVFNVNLLINKLCFIQKNFMK